jgi:hypothetical protein
LFHRETEAPRQPLNNCGRAGLVASFLDAVDFGAVKVRKLGKLRLCEEAKLA